MTTRTALRQMLALLEGERQALAALDIDRINNCSNDKMNLCARLDEVRPEDLDEECLGLLDAVRRRRAPLLLALALFQGGVSSSWVSVTPC